MAIGSRAQADEGHTVALRRAMRLRTRPCCKELAASEKERAENLMIVDLMRNDLSRIAKTEGSVKVDAALYGRDLPDGSHRW